MRDDRVDHIFEYKTSQEIVKAGILEPDDKNVLEEVADEGELVAGTAAGYSVVEEQVPVGMVACPL